MSPARIWPLLAYALTFAACCAGVYALIRISRLRFEMRRPGREAALMLFVFYLAALLAVTALRGKLGWNPGGGPRANLSPFSTTLRAARAGLWPFAYHALGNTLWFAPLGILLPSLWRGWNFPKTVLAGLLLSAAVEICQYLLGSGVPDVDDLLLNTLGAAIGYALFRCARTLRG